MVTIVGKLSYPLLKSLLLIRDSFSLDLKTKMALCKDIHEYSLNGQIYNRLNKSC